MPEKEMYLERAVREHGSYIAAVVRAVEQLRRLSFREQGASPDLFKRIGRDLGIMIGHIERSSYCPACNLVSGIQSVERIFLEVFWLFERSENDRLFLELCIQVCFDDASDTEAIHDPLSRYVGVLLRKMMHGVDMRVAESVLAHGTRSFMYH